MKKICLFVSLVMIGLTASIFGQQTIIVYDPVKEWKETKVNSQTESFVKQNIDPRDKKIWNGDNCAEDFRITGVANGSFTAKNMKQTAYLYEYCQTGNGFANDGIAIVDNGKIIRNYIFEGGNTTDLTALPDINKNGIDELVIGWGGGMHQGMMGTAVVFLEIKLKGLIELGATQSSWSNCDGDASTIKCGYSYKISVTPGIKPIFYRLKMVGGDGKKWRIIGKNQKISITRSTVEYKQAE